MYLDEAEDGVIYFSLGSLVRGETLPEDKFHAFLSVFSELPQRVLWKMDKSVSVPNVRTSRWFSQYEILSKLYY
jgi:glucuronosyltransferase